MLYQLKKKNMVNMTKINTQQNCKDNIKLQCKNLNVTFAGIQTKSLKLNALQFIKFCFPLIYTTVVILPTLTCKNSKS